MTARICIVLHSDEFGGGIQHRRATLARAWAEAGHEVTVACLKRPASSPISFAVPTVHLSLWSGRNAGLPFFASAPLTRFLRQRPFDAVLTGEPACVVTSRIAADLSRSSSRWYVSLHNPFPQTPSLPGFVDVAVQAALRRGLSYALSRADGVLSISHGVQRSYLSQLPHLNVPTSVIHNPVITDEALIDQRRRSSSPPRHDDRRRVIAVGRLHHQKGFDLLLDAVARCATSFDLVIYGEGPARADLQAQIDRLNLSDRVFLPGPDPDIFGRMLEANLFVLPSRWEGLGNVIVEALAAHLPIVAFRCPGGVEEVLEGGNHGTLIRPGDVAELASAIDEHIRKPRHPNDRWRDFTVRRIAPAYLRFMGIEPNA